MRQTKKSVMCKVLLTEKEKLECSGLLAQAFSKKKRAEEEKESFNSQIKSTISSCEAQMSLNSEKVNNGYEYRSLNCDVIYNFTAKTKSVRRPDTGEEVENDIITESELQEEIDLKDKKKPPKKKPPKEEVEKE